MKNIIWFLLLIIFFGACSVNKKNFKGKEKVVRIRGIKEGGKIVLYNDKVQISFSLKDIRRQYRRSDFSRTKFDSTEIAHIDSIRLPINNFMVENDSEEMILPLINKLLKRGKLELIDASNGKQVERMIKTYYDDFIGERETFRLLDSTIFYVNIKSL